MNRYIVAAVIAAAALLAAFVGGLRVGKRSADAVGIKYQAQIQAHQEAENAAKSTAWRLQQDADNADARAVDAGREVAEIKAKLAKLRSQGSTLPPNDDVPVSPVVDAGAAGGGWPTNGAVDSLKDELIAAQDKQIGALTDENKALRGANAALETAVRQADLKAEIQAQASKAALEGLKKSRVLDRMEWGGAALVAGYGFGRAHR